jgi:hypothetical protein
MTQEETIKFLRELAIALMGVVLGIVIGKI